MMPDLSGKDWHMSEIPRSRTSRNAKLAGLPLGIAGRAAMGFGRRLVGGDKDEINAELTRKAADQLFKVLGELKGGAMKLGQALSVMEAAIPDEYAAPYREALTKLQAEAHPMPTAAVHRMLDQQLGSAWRTRFTSFDDTPTASASIGQVHRAVWSDGRDVAVKIQYPGADDALRADLKTLTRMSSLFSALSPGQDVKGMLAEIQARTEEELDYRIEAANQRKFAKAFDRHPRFAIPKVVASSPKVMVGEWLEATRLSAIIGGGTVAERNLAGDRLAEFQFSSPAIAGLLHCDPHPGNFLMLADGRMGVIDFGACARFPNGLPKELGKLVRLAVVEDYDRITEVLYEINFVRDGYGVSAQEVAAYLRPLTDPMKTQTFHFTRKWLQRVAGPVTDLGSQEFKTSRQMNLPPEYVQIFRVLLGSIGIACQLDAEAPYMRILSEWLPGYADSAAGPDA
jgi:predicted unusual protein kinase regulating ubiquinone biosynthesis (AarF/ABC1/UbiB family)